MKTVSMQGIQLTTAERRRLQQQQQIRSLMVPLLAQQVSEALLVMEIRKEQGVKPDKQWFKETEQHGTISIAEWMGF